jgi:hypothetical protein
VLRISRTSRLGFLARELLPVNDVLQQQLYLPREPNLHLVWLRNAKRRDNLRQRRNLSERRI